MKARKSVVIFSIILALLITTVAGAQITYEKATITSYQVVNLGTNPTTIQADYYKSDGTKAFTNTFTNVPANGVVTVQQALESGLPSGQFSAVLSASEPLAAIVNQQLGETGSGNSTAPFSSYGAISSGSKEVTIPIVMHEWFGYHTELFIQNVSGTAATVTIDYKPTSLNGCTTGTATSGNAVGTLPASTAKSVSQKTLTSIAATGLTGSCAAFNGKFLGAATVKSTGGDIAVVVNQYVQDKLFTYNGFSNTGGTTVIFPAYLRNWYNYYASLTIANPGATDATVKLTYTPAAGSNPTAAITANHTVPAGKSITIYDGPGTGASDLSAAYPNGTTNRFFGSVKIESTNSVPVVAVVNQEATAAAGNQAGAYNGASSTEGTKKISVPLIQSDFYGYYTSLTIATVDGTDATVKIKYTSDGTFSSVKNTSKEYTMSTTNGVLNRYEGPPATAAQSDILDDAAWKSGGTGRFIGSAVIEVVSGSNIVAFVNSESNSAPQAATRDSLYSFNAFNVQ
ncbi:MAG: hypothetical protein KF753_00885 [Caldilineaceae bacterium]|nr:hypothetical protein [Caldilineaceae bacterium]